MRNEHFFKESGSYFSGPGGEKWALTGSGARQSLIGVILIVALFAFELFNFDTTRYALSNLLGDVAFLGVRWAAILAVAFCAIDFAGLAHLFTPEHDEEERSVIWYLMGAWLLGATMNAVMTWWAVNLTLLSHPFGNEVLTREQLLRLVPPFVAVLVWLTRILFIGAFAVAGEHFFREQRPAARRSAVDAPSGPLRRPANAPGPAKPRRREAVNDGVGHRPPTSPGTRPVPAMSARGRQGNRS
ncbi:MAG: hypothetical protein R3248_14100 [Candidatus Promineifilaceae bacterium]|nr:hypothetical protein [Candidatus Promineifilaceae bacterium]